MIRFCELEEEIPILHPTLYTSNYVAVWNAIHFDEEEKIKYIDENASCTYAIKGISLSFDGDKYICPDCSYVMRSSYIPDDKYGGIRCPCHDDDQYFYMKLL